MLQGGNHVTLCVTDLSRALAFYQDLLGCPLRARWDRGAYLEAGSLWLCLECAPADICLPRRDDTHLAFTVSAAAFTVLSARLSGEVTIWKTNKSEGESLYFLDPDGHKLEIHVGSLATRLAHWRHHPPATLRDLTMPPDRA
ncbi:VOC family protein [Asaia spathodeae]|uniref:VOC family protein n=1 Tax=Asaia spathodeae TaxID=657016 RepID=A0ABX2P6A6_9PROT|nr:VOC family protein [Asaia spathodeae]